ncbi:FAD-binding domain-containing protein 27 [Elsinoe australis]|uniref:FAD-binding domain-containing protein 27 n=1 Tax=Elsinoe australis TaxID=40998 RepID=A0A4U7B593_9PEZI|nr:FAD-binding domain-containing protein 27 [Elsinoe australis]
MLRRLLFAVSALTAVTRAEDVFEPDDFDIAKALLDRGVDTATIPELQNVQDHPSRQLPHVACSLACNALDNIYGTDQLLKSDNAEFIAFNSGYWSQQQALAKPACVFRPENADAVSVVVLISRLTTCPFAVKSGGHAAFTGGSNIPDGITVDFSRMNEVKLSEDKKIASVQPGNTWSRTYAELAKDDMVVIGGRVQNIGVGGLTTGGGISFFAGLHGWAVDNVASYEVVTAQGSIVTASPDSNPDLYWALRGGGNNFGIVVRFNYEAYPLPGNEIWGGTKQYMEPAFPAVIEAWHNTVNNAPSDPNAGGWCAFILYNNTPIVGQELYYTRPDGNNATIFDEYKPIQPMISDTTQNRNLVDYTVSLQVVQPYGLRELYAVITIKNDYELLLFAKDVFFEKIPDAANAPGSLPVLIFQSISVPILEKMQKNGGNPLGLKVEDGPFMMVQMSVWWADAKDDDLIYKSTSDILGAIKAESKSRGKDADYVYMNYAAPFQDVIAGYGEENKNKLKDIAKKYDPKMVFQELQPGYFKLDRAAMPDSPYFKW